MILITSNEQLKFLTIFLKALVKKISGNYIKLTNVFIFFIYSIYIHTITVPSVLTRFC